MHKIKINRLVDSPLDYYDEDEIKRDESNDLDILNSFISLSNTAKEHAKPKKKKDKSKKKKKDKSKKKKAKGIYDLSSLDLFDDETDSETKAKKKEADDFYEYRFNGSLVLLTNLMQEINNSTLDARDFLERMKKGRIKASPTAIATQTANVTSLLGTKLSTIKEITAVNSKISELELKKATTSARENKGKEDVENNTNLLMDRMFDKLMNSSANAKIGPEYDDDFDDDDVLVTTKDKSKKKSIDKSIDERIRELEEAGEIEFTDSELAFKYENEGVHIVVKKNINNNRWKFEARNSDGDELYDYPLPNKKSIGKMTFDMEQCIAKDGLNRTYQIIPVETLDDDEYSLDGIRRYDVDDEEDEYDEDEYDFDN